MYLVLRSDREIPQNGNSNQDVYWVLAAMPPRISVPKGFRMTGEHLDFQGAATTRIALYGTTDRQAADNTNVQASPQDVDI